MMEEKLPTKEEYDRLFWGTPLICFLDVLGFSELVKNNDHDKLLGIYKAFIQKPVDIMNQYAKGDLEFLKQYFGEAYTTNNIRIVNVSDSIVVWANDSQERTLIELLFVVKTILATAITYGVPLRGAVTKGAITAIENNGVISIVGRGLVDAYENEKIQKWSGCIVSKGIIEYIRSFYKTVMQKGETSRVEHLDSLIVEYDVPINKEHKKHFAVNWADGLKLTDAQIAEAFAAHRKREKEKNPEIIEATELKIKNTIGFYNYCKEVGKK